MKNLIAATFNQMKKPKQILVVPLTIYSGIEQGFLLTDVTRVCYMHQAYLIHNVNNIEHINHL